MNRLYSRFPWLTRNRLIAAGGAVAVLAVAGVLLAATAGGGAQGPTPSPSPSPPPTPMPSPATPPPTQPPPQTSWRLVYREFGPAEDIIWRVAPQDPAQREELARIPHREGFGTNPSLSPDGKLLAYLSLPETAVSVESSQADLFVMDLETKEAVKMAEGLDMTFTPLWSPDARLLYLRRLRGPEFLAAEISVLRLEVPRKEDPSPTPSPEPTPTPTPSPVPEGQTPAPAGTPTPTPEAVEPVMKDTIAHVLLFAPLGWAEDKRSLIFLQEDGGTESRSLVGQYQPATTEGLAELAQFAADAQRRADEENARLTNEAIANNQPAPEITVTPQPTPSPAARFVVELARQTVSDYELSPDLRRVSYLQQEFVEGEIMTRAWSADLVEAAAVPVPAQGLAPGFHLRPAWHPDGRLTVGVLPTSGGPGQVAILSLDGSSVAYLPQPASGFDEPRTWAPDGTWLLVAHNSGNSLVNRGETRLVAVAPTGQRLVLAETAANASEDAVIGWMQAP
jgi:hypothetical protein